MSHPCRPSLGHAIWPIILCTSGSCFSTEVASRIRMALRFLHLDEQTRLALGVHASQLRKALRRRRTEHKDDCHVPDCPDSNTNINVSPVWCCYATSTCLARTSVEGAISMSCWRQSVPRPRRGNHVPQVGHSWHRTRRPCLRCRGL